MSKRETAAEGNDDQPALRLDTPEGMQLFVEFLHAESRKRYEELMALRQTRGLTLMQAGELEELTRVHGTDEEKKSRMTMMEAIQAGLAD